MDIKKNRKKRQNHWLMFKKKQAIAIDVQKETQAIAMDVKKHPQETPEWGTPLPQLTATFQW